MSAITFDNHKNFAYSTVATAPSPATSGTSLVVAGGDGALFPAATFNAVVWPAGQQPTAANAEVVRVTAKSTDTFTITRATESSTARTIVVGDQIAAAVTSKLLTDIEAVLQTLTTKGDIYGFSGSAFNRLAVGTDGQVLTADSASTNGIKWAAAAGGGSSDPFAYISRAYESLDGQSFQNPTGSGAKTIDRTSDDGLSVRTGTTLNSTVAIHWADEQATPRADLMPLNIYGSWNISCGGLAASSAATAVFKWFSASNDDTVMTTDHIGLDLSKVSAAVAPKTSTGDGTTQQTTTISGGTYTSGFRNRYSFKWDGTSVSFYLNGTLKNTHSTNVPRRTSSIEWGYNSCIYAKNTTADAYTIVLSAFNLCWPILG